MLTTRIASPTMTKAGASYSSSSSLEEGNSSNSSSIGQRGNHCEECMKQPAKWYCVADEAYLCELCDAIVHSSNCVAKRHKRMRVDDMNIAEVAETSATTSSSTTTSTTTATTTTTNSATAATTRKRPRTSWGRPHSNYSTLSLRTLPPPPISAVKQEITSDFFLSTDVLPSFLADMDLPLHDMPRFLSMADDTAFFPPPSIDCSKSSPPSPSQTVSGFSPVSTTSSLDFTGDDEINCFVVPEDYTVDDLLTGCFYELHRDLHLIMGETKADTCLDMDFMDTPTSNDNSNITINNNDNNIITTANNSKNIDIVFNSVKVEVGGYTSESSDLSSEDLEEEYTINLSDFEPDENFLPDDLPEIKLETENEWVNCLRLSLNFTDVLSAWSEKDSPWLDGKRPEGIPDLQLPEVTWQAEEVRPFVPSSSNYGESFVNLDLLTAVGTCAGMGKTNDNRINNINNSNSSSGGREARVMRYREKRRTRLFSKKIRYEVRKLNAERRPRMKGRFIKRILGATDSS